MHLLINSLSDNNNDECCIICWCPENMKAISELTYIKRNCVCNPKVHETCIDTWLRNSLTCPICRTSVNIELPINISKMLYVYNIMLRFSYILNIFGFICNILLVNLARLLFYNICTIYIMSHKEDNYDLDRLLEN
jgi:hypothetical protein